MVKLRHDELGKKDEKLDKLFQELSESSRIAFLERNLNHIPLRFLLSDAVKKVRRGRLIYEGADIQLTLSSPAEVLRLRASAKEPWTVNWLEAWVKPGDVVYDIGANVGTYTLIAANQTGPTGKVIAFEPGYASFASLCENIILNQFGEVVVPLPVGLWDETILTWFHYRDVQAGAAVHSLGDRPSKLTASSYRQPILSRRLDDLVDQFGLPPATHVKLDVDGGEVHVLRGAIGALTNPALRSVLIEIDRENAEAVLDVLSGVGLRLHEQYEKRKKSGEIMSVWYGLFTPEDRS